MTIKQKICKRTAYALVGLVPVITMSILRTVLGSGAFPVLLMVSTALSMLAALKTTLSLSNELRKSQFNKEVTGLKASICVMALLTVAGALFIAPASFGLHIGLGIALACVTSGITINLYTTLIYYAVAEETVDKHQTQDLTPQSKQKGEGEIILRMLKRTCLIGSTLTAAAGTTGLIYYFATTHFTELASSIALTALGFDPLMVILIPTITLASFAIITAAIVFWPKSKDGVQLIPPATPIKL